jgi:prepilin-type N-terminal cleavage/methylation domain-containing protein
MNVQKRRRLQRGMTLVEIMVVVVIISLVAGFVGVSVLKKTLLLPKLKTFLKRLNFTS